MILKMKINLIIFTNKRVYILLGDNSVFLIGFGKNFFTIMIIGILSQQYFIKLRPREVIIIYNY